MIFEKKYFYCYILLSDQISLSGCLCLPLAESVLLPLAFTTTTFSTKENGSIQKKIYRLGYIDNLKRKNGWYHENG